MAKGIAKKKSILYPVLAAQLAVSRVLIAVAALACLIPTRGATALDPMAALRCE